MNNFRSDPSFASCPPAAGVEQAVSVVRTGWRRVPRVGIILGTGLSRFVDAVDVEEEFDYEELPGCPRPTALGHVGRLMCGRIESVPVAVLNGRAHVYEGHPLEKVTFLVHLLRGLGAETLILTCAAGGLARGMQVGEFMAIDDHIDLQFRQETVVASMGARTNAGRNFDRRHPLNREVYSHELTEQLLEIGRKQNMRLSRGTYIAVSGPNYETRAELRFFRRLGDAVGMSVVPESMVARQLGMRVCGLATITNLCQPDIITSADGEHVLDAAARVEPRFRSLIVDLVRGL